MRGIHDYRSSCIIHTSTLWPKHESILLVGFLFCASISCFYLLKKIHLFALQVCNISEVKIGFFAPDVLFGKLSHSILFTYERTGFSTQSCFKIRNSMHNKPVFRIFGWTGISRKLNDSMCVVVETSCELYFYQDWKSIDLSICLYNTRTCQPKTWPSLLGNYRSSEEYIVKQVLLKMS